MKRPIAVGDYVLAIWGITFFLVPLAMVGAPKAIPLNQSEYTLEKRDVKPSAYYDDKKNTNKEETEGEKYESWITELVLKDPPVRVPVMHEDSFPWFGMMISSDSSSGPGLRPKWLVKDKILWVAWDTASTGGSGVWTRQGHIVTLIDNSTAKILLVNVIYMHV